MKSRNRFIVFVSAVIKNTDNFLILKRSKSLSHHPDMWSIISVSIKSGETPESAIRRGAFEEAGIVIQPIKIFQTYNFFYEDDPEQESVGFVFECKYISGNVSLNEDKNSDYKWIRPQEIYDYEFTGTVKENLLEVAGLEKVNPNDLLGQKEQIRKYIDVKLNPREQDLLNILLDNFGKSVDIETISESLKDKVNGEDPSYTLVYKTISTLRKKIENYGIFILSRNNGYILFKFEI